MSQPIDQVLSQKMEEYKNIKQILIEITTDALNIYFNEKSSVSIDMQVFTLHANISLYLEKIVSFEKTHIKLLRLDGFKYQKYSIIDESNALSKKYISLINESMIYDDLYEMCKIKRDAFITNLRRYIDILNKYKEIHHIIPDMIYILSEFIRFLNASQKLMNSLRYDDHHNK